MTMKQWVRTSLSNAILVGTLISMGCSSTPTDNGKAEASVGPGGEKKFKRTDRLDRVWLADGFDFTGYDAILVEEVKVDPSVKPKDEKEADRLSLMQGTLGRALVESIDSRRIFKTVTRKDSELAAATKGLKLQSTVTKFSRGSTATRIGVGFGAGLPYVRVVIVAVETGTNKELFECELDETADWFGAGYSGSETLQRGAGMELADDVANYMARVSKHEAIKYK
jgi:hypothetical protein